MYQTPSVKRLGRIEDLTGWNGGGETLDWLFNEHCPSC